MKKRSRTTTRKNNNNKKFSTTSKKSGGGGGEISVSVRTGIIRPRVPETTLKKKQKPRFTIPLNKEHVISSDNTSFNENLYVRESHNCYMYFLNKKNYEVVEKCKETYPKKRLCQRAQPGYASGYPMMDKTDYTCPNIMERTLSDNPNIYKVDENKKCIPSHYKGALVVAPGRDYHYYRQNDDNKWTHKPGYKPSTNLDSKNNEIKNPRKALRNYGGTLNYKNFFGYLCVPREEKAKGMSHWKYGGGGSGGSGAGSGSRRKTQKKKRH